LSVSEVTAVFWFNAGNQARKVGDLAGARRAFERAVADAPTFAEAQASLGAVRQLEGALPEAERAYRDAERSRADLPGLDQNMALLRRERRLESAPSGAAAESSPSLPASRHQPPQ
jgi:Flp pilus assembly protein TadD